MARRISTDAMDSSVIECLMGLNEGLHGKASRRIQHSSPALMHPRGHGEVEGPGAVFSPNGMRACCHALGALEVRLVH